MKVGGSIAREWGIVRWVEKSRCAQFERRRGGGRKVSGPNIRVDWKTPVKSIAGYTDVLDPVRRFLSVDALGAYVQLTAFFWR